MATRFMTDPHEMRSMAGRFDCTPRRSRTRPARCGRRRPEHRRCRLSGSAQATSYDTMGQMNQAFRNIVNMLHGVRDGLIRDANDYESQEQASQQILS